MGADYRARQIYQSVIHDVTKNEKVWQDILKLAGHIYRYEFENVVMVYAQKPHATLVADYDTWKKVGRYVRRGSRGAAVFQSKALKPNCRYVFDIKDTGGKDRELTWNMEGENLNAYVDYLVRHGEMEPAAGSDKETLKNAIKLFTKERIGGIIKEEFAKQMTDVTMLAGRVIEEQNGETQEEAVKKLVFNSIFYTVAARCGIELSSKERDMRAIVNISSEDVIYALGSLVCDVSCTVLREISVAFAAIERERRMDYEPVSNQVPRSSGRNDVPEHPDGKGGPDGTHEVRDNGVRLSESQSSGKVQADNKVRDGNGNLTAGTGGSLGTPRHDRESVSEKTQAREPGFYDGNVENQGAGGESSGGNGFGGDREPVPLISEEELKKELDEINSSGNEREADYKQASLFEYMEAGHIGSVLSEEEKEELERDNELDEYAIPDEVEEMGVPDNKRAELMEQEEAARREEAEALLEQERQTGEEAGETVQEPEEEKDMEPENPKAQVPGTNFHMDIWHTENAGPKTRCGWNIEAIRLLKHLEKEGRPAAAEEQEILAKYVGWGGLSQIFDERNESWSREYAMLKELLTEEEYKAARATVNNAFYTPSEVASAMCSALARFGFEKGNVLEPSMGIGNFFGCMPASLSESRLYGVEIDDISGRIARQLYPQAKIEIKGFEQTDYPDNFFDVVIGNVPFGDYKVYDTRYNKMNLKIHDYFVARAIDQARPGGMVAVITTKGTLDKQNASMRKYLAERAELVGAVRLPISVFKGNAGTEVTSDILFFQKRERKETIEPEWVHLGFTEDGIAVNRYFAEHPEMMLGHMEYDKGRFGDKSNYTICVNEDENFNLYEALQNAFENIHAEIKDFELALEDGEALPDTIPADPDVKNYTYTILNGSLYYRKDSVMFQKKAGDKLMARIKGLHQIRTVTRHLIDIQAEGCTEEELKQVQAELNRVYDSFVKQHGYITSNANSRAFRDDGDYPLLCSLEKVDEDGNVEKADMFYRQTIKSKKQVDRVETAVEALHLSLNEHGEVSLAYMLSVYEPDISAAYREQAGRTGEAAEDIHFSEEEVRELKRQKMVGELAGVIFLNPETYNENDLFRGWETADEYLSGNVRDKLRLAKAAAKEKPELFAGNVEALEKAQPKDLEAGEIEVKLGTTWIEPEDYQQFIFELLQTPAWLKPGNGYEKSAIRVRLNRYNMEWFIENKSMDKSVVVTKKYGTGRIGAYGIIEASMNLRTVTVKDRIDDGGGKYHYEVNKKETMLAKNKQDEVKQAFKDWIWREPERRRKYVDYYNETFNNIRLREYDGSHLEFPGMNPDIHLNPHQENAIARILMGGNTLLAHCVGAGKSFEMMAACMEQKRLGLANKTIMAVPKALIEQTASEFLRLYPSANILVARENDFSKKKRQQFIARIATGDYDCIIMSHNQFEKIPVSRERRMDILDRQIEEMSYAIMEMKSSEDGGGWTVKQMESEKKKMEEKLEEMTAEERKDDLINFEELGVDSILVDEAHAYKNMAVFSKMNNVAGISGSGSQRAMDMFLKCQYISEINAGRGIVFATGTPISNTMCEMYVMQCFLQKDALERMGIYHFDSWAANFGETTTALELNVEGSGFRFKERFNRFTNLPELMNLFKEVADIQTKDMLDLDVPELRGGKYVIVESEPDSFMKEVMEQFVERAEAIHNGLDPHIDNFLKITHEARLLGTDARLLYPEAPDNPDGKLNKVAENVYREYRQAEEQGIIGTQLIFSDIGTPGGKEFDVYHHLKEQLVIKGIPAEEIAFIHDAKTDAQRDTLFRQMRSGEKKVLIGSTDKCGTGVNVQTHLVAMHHVDCPWKPSSIEQREGRGIRQGNENKEIAVYRYVTKGTFDAYSWSLVENKQRFISQIMTSRAVSRSCEDIDEATLSYAEIKAVATGSPLIREKMEVDNDVQKLKMLKASYDNEHYGFQDAFLTKYPKLIAAAEERLAGIREDITARDKAVLAEPDFSIKVDGVTYSERKDGGAALLSARNKCGFNHAQKIGKYKGFEVLAERNVIGYDYLVLRGRTDYKVDMSLSEVGNIVKLENRFNGIQDLIPDLEKKLEGYRMNMEQAKAEFEKPFAHEKELKEKLKRQSEINALLNVDSEEEKQVVLEPEPELERDSRELSH